jgi:hypothetical protein
MKPAPPVTSVRIDQQLGIQFVEVPRSFDGEEGKIRCNFSVVSDQFPVHPRGAGVEDELDCVAILAEWHWPAPTTVGVEGIGADHAWATPGDLAPDRLAEQGGHAHASDFSLPLVDPGEPRRLGPSNGRYQESFGL